MEDIPGPRGRRQSSKSPSSIPDLWKQLGLKSVGGRDTSEKLGPSALKELACGLSEIAEEFCDLSKKDRRDSKLLQDRCSDLVNSYGSEIWPRIGAPPRRRTAGTDVHPDADESQQLNEAELFWDTDSGKISNLVYAIAIKKSDNERKSRAGPQGDDPHPRCYATRGTWSSHLDASLLEKEGIWLGDYKEHERIVTGISYWELMKRSCEGQRYGCKQRPEMTVQTQTRHTSPHLLMQCVRCQEQYQALDIDLVRESLHFEHDSTKKRNKIWILPCYFDEPYRKVFAILGHPKGYRITDGSRFGFWKVQGGYTNDILLAPKTTIEAADVRNVVFRQELYERSRLSQRPIRLPSDVALNKPFDPNMLSTMQREARGIRSSPLHTAVGDERLLGPLKGADARSAKSSGASAPSVRRETMNGAIRKSQGGLHGWSRHESASKFSQSSAEVRMASPITTVISGRTRQRTSTPELRPRKRLRTLEAPPDLPAIASRTSTQNHHTSIETFKPSAMPTGGIPVDSLCNPSGDMDRYKFHLRARPEPSASETYPIMSGIQSRIDERLQCRNRIIADNVTSRMYPFHVHLRAQGSGGTQDSLMPSDHIYTRSGGSAQRTWKDAAGSTHMNSNDQTDPASPELSFSTSSRSSNPTHKRVAQTQNDAQRVGFRISLASRAEFADNKQVHGYERSSDASAELKHIKHNREWREPESAHLEPTRADDSRVTQTPKCLQAEPTSESTFDSYRRFRLSTSHMLHRSSISRLYLPREA